MWKILYKTFLVVDEPVQEAWKDLGRFLCRKHYEIVVKKKQMEKEKDE